MKVHFASGPHPFEGWVNVDYTAKADIKADLLSPTWPSELHNLHDIYVGHFLEHLTYAEAGQFLGRVRDISIPGARLTVVGPDVERAQRMLDQGAIDQEFYNAVAAHGEISPEDPNNRGAVHMWDCTPGRVKHLLSQYGWGDAVEIPIARLPQMVPGVPVISAAPWQFALVTYAENVKKN